MTRQSRDSQKQMTLKRGHMSFPLAFIKRLLITVAGKKHFNSFSKSLSQIEESQYTVLKDIITRAAETAFGVEHKFDTITDIHSFRDQVPVRNFEEHRPYIDRIINGESDILFPGRPISYNMTSGTTAQPKFIPISQSYNRKFNRLNRIWYYSWMKEVPSVFNGRSLSAVSPAVEGYCKDGISFGSLSGNSYQNVPSILKTTFSSPYPVITIEDYGKKYYAMMRGALACDITCITCASPSNLLKLHETVLEHFEDMVNDIRYGTLRPDVLECIPAENRREVEQYYKADPSRADELEKLYNIHGKELKLKHYFPNLLIVNTWKQGNFKRIIPQLEGMFPDSTAIRAMGYQASEARAGMVLFNDWDFSLLAHDSFFYEFIEENERGWANPRFKMLHELEEGKRYYLYITNDSGLFRYDINDIIEVTGYYEGAPKIAFVQKGDGITNVTGEKLSEQQVIMATEYAAEKLKLSIPFFMMYCSHEEMSYTKYVEFADNPTSELKKQFILEFDQFLTEINPEYKIKRGTARLNGPELKELKPKSYEALKQELILQKRAKDGQFKDLYLHSKKHVRDILETLTI